MKPALAAALLLLGTVLPARTYRNRCELERAGEAPFHVGFCP